MCVDLLNRLHLKNMDLQNLLWKKEYVCLVEEILIENKFVMEQKNGEPVEMVLVGVTESGLVMARFTSDDSGSDSDLDHIELSHWFPIKYIKLSPAKDKKHTDPTLHGNVLKLKLKNGQSWLLELSERNNRERIWEEWLSIIPDLKDRPRNKSKRGNKRASTNDNNVNEDSIVTTQNDVNGRSLGQPSIVVEHAKSDTSLRKQSTDFRAINNLHAYNSKTSLQMENARRHVRTTGNKLILSNTILRPRSYTSIISSSSQQLSGERKEVGLLFSIGTLFGLNNVLTLRHGHSMAEPMVSTSALDKLEELEGYSQSNTITDPVTAELCRIPMSKSVSLPDRLDGEAGFLEDSAKAGNAVHREELAYADLLTEVVGTRACLVNGHVMLLNAKQMKLHQKIERQREEFNDFVYTVRQEKKMIEKTVVSKRKESCNFDASNPHLFVPSCKKCTGINRMTQECHGKQQEGTPAEDQNEGIHKNKRTNKIRNFFCLQEPEIVSNSAYLAGKSRSTRDQEGSVAVVCSCHQVDHEADQSSHNELFESIGYIDPSDVANEMTCIDREMLLRLHESELADCAWQKIGKEVHAKNVLAIVDICMRIVGLLATEILKETCVNLRTERIANVIDIATECRRLNNYHSLRICLAALQIIPIHRLYETWRNLEDEYPEKLRILGDLEEFSTSANGYTSFRQAMRTVNSSPCIPFIGTFLQEVIASEFEFDETLIDANIKKSSAIIHQTEAPGDEYVDVDFKSPATDWHSELPFSKVDGQEAKPSKTNCDIPKEKGSSNAKHLLRSSISHAMHSFASAWRALRPPITSRPIGTSQLNDAERCRPNEQVPYARYSPMTPDRKKHIQKLILAYARKLRYDTKANSGWIDDDYFNWGNLFHFVRIHAETETKRSSSCESSEHHGSEDVVRGQVNRTLFLFQSAAVQYDIECNLSVREYLLTKAYISADELYKRSRILEEP